MFDFQKFAQENGVPMARTGHHHCHSGWIQTHCPICTDCSHGFHLGWSIKKGNMSCWRCGNVSIMKFLSLRMGSGRARFFYAKYCTDKPIPVIVAKRDLTVASRVREPKGMKTLTPKHREFLRARGFLDVPSLVEEWEIWGTNHLASSLWRWRVISPVKDENGKVVSYVGRSIGKSPKKKYVYSRAEDTAADPKSLLYGIHWAMGDYVLIVEGPIDVWKLGPGAVATNGISWSKEQISSLRKFKKRFILFDPEIRAMKKAMELAETLSIFPGETEVITGLESDPGDMSPKEALKLRKYLGV